MIIKNKLCTCYSKQQKFHNTNLCVLLKKEQLFLDYEYFFNTAEAKTQVSPKSSELQKLTDDLLFTLNSYRCSYVRDITLVISKA